MAKQLVRSHADKEDFSSDFWTERGLEEDPSSRERMLALAIDELAVVGPASFNATVICDRLGFTYPMVNHYFGNRDGLIAEATFTAYVNYVESLKAAAMAVSSGPRDQMAAWIYAQLDWSRRNSGIAVVLNYPASSLEVTALLEQRFASQMRRYFEYNMAVLMTLIRGVQKERMLPLDFTVDTYDREGFLADSREMTLAASIGLSALGAAIWYGGSHAPSSGVAEVGAHMDATLAGHVEELINRAARG